MITGTTKCSRDPTRIRSLITEAKCYKIRMYHKDYLIETNRASVSRLYPKKSLTTADSRTSRSPPDEGKTGISS